MEKVFRTYATRMGVPARSLSFLLDGRRLNNDDTSVALGLEDQDQIDCVPDQAFDAHTKPWRPPSSCTCLSPDYETVKEGMYTVGRPAGLSQDRSNVMRVGTSLGAET